MEVIDTIAVELVEKNTAKVLLDVKEDIKVVVEDVKEAVDEVKDKAEEIKQDIDDVLDEKLTEEQQTILVLFYEDAKAAVEVIVSSSLPAPVKLAKMLGALMKLFEKVQHHGKAISGSNKKTVVMAIMKRLLKDLVPDRDVLAELLAVYRDNAEYLLETLADVSRTLNVVTELAEIAESGCCASILSLLSKK